MFDASERSSGKIRVRRKSVQKPQLVPLTLTQAWAKAAALAVLPVLVSAAPLAVGHPTSATTTGLSLQRSRTRGGYVSVQA